MRRLVFNNCSRAEGNRSTITIDRINGYRLVYVAVISAVENAHDIGTSRVRDIVFDQLRQADGRGAGKGWAVVRARVQRAHTEVRAVGGRREGDRAVVVGCDWLRGREMGMRRDQISYLAGAIMTTLIGLGISSLVFSYVSDFTFFESCLIFFGTLVRLKDEVPREEIKAYADHISKPEWSPLVLPDSWKNLKAFDDSAIVLKMLRRHFMVVTLSNGPLGLQAALLKNNDVDVDAIVPLEIAQVFKPNPRAYWASRMLGDWVQEKIDKILYLYYFNSSTTETQKEFYK